MPDIGAPELLLVLLITLFVFGGSKVADIGGSLGKSIKEFKKAINEDEPAAVASAPAATPVVTIAAAGAVLCPRCHVSNLPNAQFCNECGSSMTAPAAAPAGTVTT